MGEGILGKNALKLPYKSIDLDLFFFLLNSDFRKKAALPLEPLKPEETLQFPFWPGGTQLNVACRKPQFS